MSMCYKRVLLLLFLNSLWDGRVEVDGVQEVEGGACQQGEVQFKKPNVKRIKV